MEVLTPSAAERPPRRLRHEAALGSPARAALDSGDRARARRRARRGLWAPWRAEKPVDRPLTRLDVDLGADVSLPAPGPSGAASPSPPMGRGWHTPPAAPRSCSPGGWINRKPPSSRERRGQTGPFFSPDGQWVGFVAGGKLNKISVEGGAVVPLGDVYHLRRRELGRGRQHHRERRCREGLAADSRRWRRARDSRGNGQRRSALARPQILPGGKAILFTAAHGGGRGSDTLSRSSRWRIATGRSWPEAAHPPGIWPRRAGPGHLVYVNKATLFAVPFDLDKLETRGTAVPVLDDVAYHARPGPVNLISPGDRGHGVWSTAGPAAARPQ